MNTLVNNHDTLETLIYTENIRIKDVQARPEEDILLITLNTGSVLQEKLSKYPRLKNATAEMLQQYELIGKGTGISWPLLDEDLSLKGFLRNIVRNQVLGNSKIA